MAAVALEKIGEGKRPFLPHRLAPIKLGQRPRRDEQGEQCQPNPQ